MIMDILDKSDIPAPDEVNRYAILAKLPPEHMLTGTIFSPSANGAENAATSRKTPSPDWNVSPQCR